MLSKEKCETSEVRVTTDKTEVGLNKVKSGVRNGRILPLATVTEKESLKIENDSKIFCDMQALLNFGCCTCCW